MYITLYLILVLKCFNFYIKKTNPDAPFIQLNDGLVHVGISTVMNRRHWSDWLNKEFMTSTIPTSHYLSDREWMKMSRERQVCKILCYKQFKKQFWTKTNKNNSFVRKRNRKIHGNRMTNEFKWNIPRWVFSDFFVEMYTGEIRCHMLYVAAERTRGMS